MEVQICCSPWNFQLSSLKGEAVLLLVKESNGSLKKWKPCLGMLGSTAKVDVEEEDKGLFLLTSLSDLYENLVKLYCKERNSKFGAGASFFGVE